MPESTPHRHLPRLEPQAYRGRQFVHWIMAMANRREGWLTPEFHAGFRRILAKAESAHAVAVPTYCLMPDHMHILAAGLTPRSDQRLWIRGVRRSLNAALSPCRLQKEPYDHVLRRSETGQDAFASLVHYVVHNPVRAEMVDQAGKWTFTGACVSGLPGLDPLRHDFMARWWEYHAVISGRAWTPAEADPK